MSVHKHKGTMPGGVTPICNDCGVSLCWDIAESEYAEAKPFWDAWKCEQCNGGKRMSLSEYKAANPLDGVVCSDCDFSYDLDMRDAAMGDMVHCSKRTTAQKATFMSSKFPRKCDTFKLKRATPQKPMAVAPVAEQRSAQVESPGAGNSWL